MTPVKICGLSTPESLKCAVENGVRYVGLVFYPPSPRAVSFDIAWNLARTVPTGTRSVGLFVDPDDALLERILTGVQLDMIQLHGNETPGRIAEIKEQYQMPVMKAIRVATPNDLTDLPGYEAAADWLLFDAKPQNADLPGGMGKTFDWSILAGREFTKPWMLSGGLNTENMTEALSVLKPNALDVSSGVEGPRRGEKDLNKIKAFLNAAKNA